MSITPAPGRSSCYGSNVASRKEEEKPRDQTPPPPKTGDGDANDEVQPASEKIPEGEGNLRRRADWFQKRTGGSE